MEISVTSILYCAGNTEDGREYHAERYLVWAEAKDGTRYEHTAFFNGCRTSVCEEDGYTGFEDIREEAEAKAETLAARVRAHLATNGKLNVKYWHEIDPAYGSAAYIGQGIEQQRVMLEKLEG